LSLRLPVIRQGRAYESLETLEVADARSGQTLAEIGQANPGLVARDIARWPTTTAPDSERLSAIFERAARDLLDRSDPDNQKLADRVAATTGLTRAQVHSQMQRLAMALRSLMSHMPVAPEPRKPMAFVLPSNAPGVHSAWLTALALGHPVVLKPGAREPWTPYRLTELLWRAGLPPSMVGIYPGDHATSRAIIQAATSCVLFGDEATVERYHGVSSVDVRGPGRSKALVSAEAARDPELVTKLAHAITEFGGRSCLNTSSIGVMGGSRSDLEDLREALEGVFKLMEPDALAAWPTRAEAQGIASWLGRLGGPEATPGLVQRGDGLWALEARAVVVDPWTAELASLEAPCPWVGLTSLSESQCSDWTRGSLAVSVHGSEADSGSLMESLSGVDRLVAAGSMTTDATDISFHVEALGRLAP
jgi:hypothetical protein